MNYIFCDKKCCRELKDIGTLLDAKCSDIDEVIKKLKEEKKSSETEVCTGEFVGFGIGILLTAAVAYVLARVHIAIGVGSILVLGPTLVCMGSLIGLKIDKTGANKVRTKVEAVDQVIKNLREFKENFEQLRDKIRLSELSEIARLSCRICEFKDNYSQIFLDVAECDNEKVQIRVAVEAETKRSKDGTAEFHTLGRKATLTIAKDFCEKIFPNPDTCDFSWMNATSEQCLYAVKCISENVDAYKNTDSARMLEMKLDD